MQAGNTHYHYDAFGNEQNANPTDANIFRYCGEYWDKETETYYLRARYYAPRTGRFVTEDPIRDGLNWYTYCGNNPIMFVDPSGLILRGSDITDFGEDSRTYTSLSSLYKNWEVASKTHRKDIKKIADEIRRISFDRLEQGLSLKDFGIPQSVGSIKLNSTEMILMSDMSTLERAQFITISAKAKIDTTVLFSGPAGADDVEGNAFQHALWNFNLINVFGQDRAKLYTDAHEFGTIDIENNAPTYGSLSTQMDLANNATAQNLYNDYITNGVGFNPMAASASQYRYLINQIGGGQFNYIDNTRNLVPTNGNSVRWFYRGYLK